MAIRLLGYHSFSLDAAEVGDKLMVQIARGRASSFIAVTITKVTKTTIKTSDGRRWMRDSQKQFGGCWRGSVLRRFDEEKIKVSMLEARRRHLIQKVSMANLNDFSVESLNKIASIIDAETSNEAVS